jgi:hypothetical protein
MPAWDLIEMKVSEIVARNITGPSFKNAWIHK